MTNPENLNQTTFQETEPIFEKPSLPQATTTVRQFSDEEEMPESKPVSAKRKNTPLIIVGVGIFFLLLLSILLLMAKPTKRRIQTATALPSPTPQTQAQTQLQREVDQLDTDIKSADPQNNSLPFPPVNFNLHLKPPAASQ